MKKGWEYKTIGELFPYVKNGANIKQSKGAGGIPITRIETLANGVFNYDRLGYADIVDAGKYEKNILSKGDILMSHINSLEHIGRAVTYKGDEKIIHGMNLLRLIPIESVDTDYCCFYFKTKKFKKAILSITHKSVNQASFNTSSLKNLSIPIPPLSEQKGIVDYLDSSFAKIDKLKENAAKNLEEAKALFQSALKDALEPKEGWEEKTLEHIATEMYRGSGIKRDQVTEEGISCVRYGEIYTTYNYFFDVCKSHTNEGIITSKKYFENGDILFAITGESVEEIGKSIAYLGKEKCLAGGDIVVMKHNQNLKFLSYALSTPNAIKQKGYGKTKLKVVHTNIPSLKTIKIPIPSIQEQIKIAEFLDSLNEKVNTLQQNYSRICSECDALKQSILRQVFE